MKFVEKYRPNPGVHLPDRTWPSRELQKAPIWCSVDLRDGNQALVEPMQVDAKLRMFRLLRELGFREIEVGFPASSQIEFDFLRELVDRGEIPADMKIQVLVPCREDLIRRTFEALQGVEQAIFHIYNSTSTLQRRVVFQKSEDEVLEIAVRATRLVKELSKEFPGKILLEYSPESFTGTELPYALRICEAVLDEWGATKENPVIINLPATVEMTMPNVYADRIEWMSRSFRCRDRLILSVHPHNDRGTGIAATELALLAGAERVEGTLFGNGERTGNIDLLTLAYNMFSQGLDPGLELNEIEHIVRTYEECTTMEVGPRHPYAGKLVFTAFSGSHQDAIHKGVRAMQERGDGIWAVPYLPIDPTDIGRSYEPIVRINSQSGKGGIAYVMDSCFGYRIPKSMQREFADKIQLLAESMGEVSPELIMETFRKEYLDLTSPYHFISMKTGALDNVAGSKLSLHLIYERYGERVEVDAEGTGPIDAVRNALSGEFRHELKVLDYSEHALGSGSNAKAAAYIRVEDTQTKRPAYGAGLSSNITRAGIRALFSAVNRLRREQESNHEEEKSS